MGAQLNPYLNFRHAAKEAMTFYQRVFGGELSMSTFGEFQASDDPAEADKIMHAQLTTDKGFVLMAADLPNQIPGAPANGAVSLSGDDEALRGYWDKLSEGGSVNMPLAAAPWGDTFGMVTDRFDVSWLVNISGQSS